VTLKDTYVKNVSDTSGSCIIIIVINVSALFTAIILYNNKMMNIEQFLLTSTLLLSANVLLI